MKKDLYPRIRLTPLTSSCQKKSLHSLNCSPLTTMTSGRQSESIKDGLTAKNAMMAKKKRHALYHMKNCPNRKKTMTETRRPQTYSGARL